MTFCIICNKEIYYNFPLHEKTKKHIDLRDGIKPITTPCLICRIHVSETNYEKHLLSKTHIKKETALQHKEKKEDNFTITCEVCDKSINKYKYQNHILTKQHVQNALKSIK